MKVKSPQIKGIVGTIIVHALLLLCFFFFGFKTPLPLPAEQGIEIDMGGGGGGSASSSEIIEETQPSNSENNATQDIEEAPSLTKTEKPVITKKDISTEKKIEEPKIDSRLLYKKGKGKKGSGEGDGDGSGIGNGKGTGKGNGIGDGDGDGIGPGKGPGFSLTGRSAKLLPKPSFDNVQGKVVVRIKVDRNGKVIDAEAISKGSTIANTKIWKVCEEYAMKAKFSAKSDAAEVQMGTITYVIQ